MIFADFDRPSWGVLGKTWPHKQASRFIDAGTMRWHVQVMGDGPPLLLLHGTAASGHSWRDLIPLLAKQFRVIVPDLPGHGFSNAPPVIRLTLPRVAAATEALLSELNCEPALVVGHSAGAAILLHMALNKQIDPQGIVGINGAYLPFPGAAGAIFPSLARLLYLNPLAPRLFAAGGRSRGRIERLIGSTGSTIGDDGIDFYQQLITAPGHVSGALAMMASWDLQPLEQTIGKIDRPLLLIAGDNDKAVSPDVSRQVARRTKYSKLVNLPGLGHLAHEERPEEVGTLISAFATEVGALPADPNLI